MSEMYQRPQSVIITGGSMGLGYAIAEAFLAEGRDVLISSRNLSDLESAKSRLQSTFLDRRIEILAADVRCVDAAELLCETALDKFGNFGVLVNNAGVHGSIGVLESADFDEWINAIQTNLIGCARICREAIKQFSNTGEGRIINISGGGATIPQYGLSAYAASKAALVRLTETLALEEAGRRITVNAVAPGALVTRLTEELARADPTEIGAEAHGKVLKMRAQGGSSVAKAAKLCVYLASSEAEGLSGRLISAVWDPWPFSKQQIESIMSSDIYTLRRIVPEDRDKTW